MSYILDALKRAEAERNGATPVRNALPAAFVAATPAKRASRALLWFAPLLAGAAIGALLLGMTRDAAAPADSAAPKPVAPVPARATPEPPAAVIIPPPGAVAPRQVATTAPAPAAVKPKRQTLGTLRDLPESVQRDIPPLVIGGYLYSAKPADRTVLINNRLRHEGDEVAPGLILETLQPNGMVLNYRGYRYRSTY